MIRPGTCIVCFGLAFIAGCTFIPEYVRPAATIPAAYPRLESENAPSPAADLEWRSVFSDPRIVRLIELALSHNLDLRTAILNVEQARANCRIQRAGFYPTIDGSVAYSGQRPSGLEPNEWTASIGTAAYELDLFGRVRSLSRQALESYFASEEGSRAAQVSLVASVATEYYTMRELLEQLEVARGTLASVEESYELNQNKYKAGESTELDLRTAEGQIHTAEVSILDYRRQTEQAYNDLCLLTGQALPADLAHPSPLASDEGPREIPAGVPSDLIARRPDVLQAEHTLKAANANIGVARAAFFPSLAITSSVGESSPQFSKLFGSSTAIWSFSPQLTVPLFTGGLNRANLDVAQLGVQIDIAAYQKAIQTAFREVADALAGRRAYKEELAPQAALVAAQQRRYDLARIRYRQGEDSYLNVLSAQQDLYSAELNLASIRFNIAAAGISLYEALGGGWK